MLSKQRLEKIKNFNAIELKFEDDSFILILKNLTLDEKEFIHEYFVLGFENLDYSDKIECLMFCLEGSTREQCDVILSSDEATIKVIDSLFTSNNLNLKFEESFANELKSVLKNSNKLVSSLKKIMVSYGYKVLELNKLTQQELLNLSIQEMLYRDKQVLSYFVEEICLDPSIEENKILKSREGLYSIIKEFINENELSSIFDIEKEVQQTSQPGLSAFDQLSNMS